MTRFLLLFTLIFTSFSHASALEEFPFFGISASSDEINLDDPFDKLNSKESFGLRYGKQSTEWRTMFTLQGNSDFTTFSIEMDKILMDSMFGYPEVRPYLGLNVGYIFYDVADYSYEDTVFDGDGSITYGGSFGFLFYITDNIDMDISYHYYDVPDLEPLDYMSGFSLGLHYFY